MVKQEFTYYCDRCGREFSDYTLCNGNKLLPLKEVWVHLGFKKFNGEICEECSQELEEYLDNFFDEVNKDGRKRAD